MSYPILRIAEELGKLNNGDVVTFGLDSDVITADDGLTCVASVADVSFPQFEDISGGEIFQLMVYDSEVPDDTMPEGFGDRPDTVGSAATVALVSGIAVGPKGARRARTRALTGEQISSGGEAAMEQAVDQVAQDTIADLAEDEKMDLAGTFGWTISDLTSILELWAYRVSGKELNLVFDASYVHAEKKRLVLQAHAEQEKGEVITVGVLDSGQEVIMPYSVLDDLMKQSGETQAEVMKWIMDSFNSGAYLSDPSIRSIDPDTFQEDK